MGIEIGFETCAPGATLKEGAHYLIYDRETRTYHIEQHIGGYWIASGEGVAYGDSPPRIDECAYDVLAEASV